MLKCTTKHAWREYEDENKTMELHDDLERNTVITGNILYPQPSTNSSVKESIGAMLMYHTADATHYPVGLALCSYAIAKIKRALIVIDL